MSEAMTPKRAKELKGAAQDAVKAGSEFEAMMASGTAGEMPEPLIKLLALATSYLPLIAQDYLARLESTDALLLDAEARHAADVAAARLEGRRLGREQGRGEVLMHVRGRCTEVSEHMVRSKARSFSEPFVPACCGGSSYEWDRIARALPPLDAPAVARDHAPAELRPIDVCDLCGGAGCSACSRPMTAPEARCVRLENAVEGACNSLTIVCGSRALPRKLYDAIAGVRDVLRGELRRSRAAGLLAPETGGGA